MLLLNDASGNDIFFGTNFGATTTNITNIVTTMQSIGTTVYVGTAVPRTGIDLTPLVNFVNTNYSSSIVIDSFQPFANGAGGTGGGYDTPLGLYYWTDLTHLNDAGYTMLSQIIVQKLLQQ